MIFLSFLILILFSSCQTINPAEDQTQYYTAKDFSAVLTSTGYGKNSNLLPKYSEGTFSNIFQDDETFYKFKTNPTDSTGSSTNSFTITLNFPENTTVTSIKSYFQTNSSTTPSFSVKKTTSTESKSVTATFQNDSEFSIPIKDSVSQIEITISINKYVSSAESAYYLSILKLIPEFS